VSKIAVIGAGIYGTTVAIKLADNGYEVDLFERENDILQAASGINQYRLHRGYHYPRSKDTGESSRKANPLFEQTFKEAIIDKNKHYYCIPKEKSKVSGKDFLKFCYDSGLEHTESKLSHVEESVFDTIVECKESLVDPIKLREIVWGMLKGRSIKVLLSTAATAKVVESYPIVINCAYANLNAALESYPEARRNYQFELCEKPILRLPDRFIGVSAVVMDGPFFCIDPYAETGLHLMGNVVHAIHATNVGLFPNIPDRFRPLLNKGIVKEPSITNIDKFIDSASYFMPELKKAEHIGSMYTIRTVLPCVDHTDERPTIVSRVNNKIINVFSGKLGNSVHAAQEVVRLVNQSFGPPRSFYKPAKQIAR
jgi:hypothetical protein